MLDSVVERRGRHANRKEDKSWQTIPSVRETFLRIWGFPHPMKGWAKAKLAYKINRLIADHRITQKDAAIFLGISQSKMTALRNGRLKNFTIDYLVSLFRRMNSSLQKLQGQ